jgi:predicted amidohydrolase YtcJ
VIHPDDLPRFAELDVVGNAQALWAAHEDQMDVLTIPFLGPERTTWQYPFGALLRSGARLAMGSDWGVSSPDPLAAILIAVNRTTPRAIDPTMHTSRFDPFLPEQALTLAEAIHGYTAGSAWVNHLDADTGTIEVGKLADLAVIDRDLFEIPPMTLADARVLATIVGGEVVHETPTLG